MRPCSFFFFNDTATTEIYTLSLHDALPISRRAGLRARDLTDTARHARWGRQSAARCRGAPALGQWVRLVPRDDRGALRDRDRRRGRHGALACISGSLEARRSRAPCALPGAGHAPARLATVGPGA